MIDVQNDNNENIQSINRLVNNIFDGYEKKFHIII